MSDSHADSLPPSSSDDLVQLLSAKKCLADRANMVNKAVAKLRATGSGSASQTYGPPTNRVDLRDAAAVAAEGSKAALAAAAFDAVAKDVVHVCVRHDAVRLMSVILDHVDAVRPQAGEALWVHTLSTSSSPPSSSSVFHRP